MHLKHKFRLNIFGVIIKGTRTQMNFVFEFVQKTSEGSTMHLWGNCLTSSALCCCFIILSCAWSRSLLPMSMVLLGPGLRPKDGAEPTEPSDRTSSLLDRESAVSRDSDGGRVETGSLIWETDG